MFPVECQANRRVGPHWLKKHILDAGRLGPDKRQRLAVRRKRRIAVSNGAGVWLSEPFHFPGIKTETKNGERFAASGLVNDGERLAIRRPGELPAQDFVPTRKEV